MKKVIVSMLVLTFVLTGIISAAAADGSFVPSVSYKGSPEIVVSGQENGKNVIGAVVDGNGNKLSTEYDDCIVISSVVDAKNAATGISQQTRSTLLSVYDQLSAKNAKLSALIPGLNDIAKEKLGANATADDLVVSDLFDITAVCDELKSNLTGENSIMLTFRLPAKRSALVATMVYYEGKWEPAEKITHNADGTVSITFKRFCPVAFLIKGESNEQEQPLPPSGDDTNLVFLASILAVSAFGLITTALCVRFQYNKNQ